MISNSVNFEFQKTDKQITKTNKQKMISIAMKYFGDLLSLTD